MMPIFLTMANFNRERIPRNAASPHAKGSGWAFGHVRDDAGTCRYTMANIFQPGGRHAMCDAVLYRAGDAASPGHMAANRAAFSVKM